MKKQGNNFKDRYNKLYLHGYREKLSEYEFARWNALDHFVRNVSKLDDNRIKKVLDYGSGIGLFTGLWKKLFPRSTLYFCDVSTVALKRLKKNYPEFKSSCAEIKESKAQFKNNSFDLVVSIEVMEHVGNLNDYLKDIYRVLKPGGIFIWTTPCGNCFSIEHIFNIFNDQIEKTKEGNTRWKWEDRTHLRRLKSREIKKELETYGFTNIFFRFRAHFFSFFCTNYMRGPLTKIGEKMMSLDYLLFRRIPNGASMIGYAEKSYDKN